MATIKKIRLTDLMFYNTVTHIWENLYAVDTAVATERDLGPGSQYKPVLYDAGAGTGLDPAAPYNYGLNWDYFAIDDGTGISEEWTLFYTGIPHEGTHLLASTIKSLRVRYKIEVEDDSDPANTFAPNQYYYQIIGGAYPADHILYMGTITTGPFAPTAYVKLPGISNTMVPNAALLFSWLTDVNNWKMVWKRPDLSEREFTPSSAIISGVYDSTDVNYNGAYVNVKLTFPTLMVGQSGSHTLTISMLPNDQQTSGFTAFADVNTWTAVITAYSPTMEAPLLMSFDKTLFMTINFAPSA